MGRSCFALPQAGSGDDAFHSSSVPAEPPSGSPGCRPLRGLTTAGVCVWLGFHQGSPTPRGPLTLTTLSALDLRNG
eukprot:830815-Prymnesium_polylepis.1